MTITEAIKKLTAIKKKHGDIEISVHMKSFGVPDEELEYLTEPFFDFKVDKVRLWNLDTERLERKKTTVATIRRDCF